jgi:Sds3-like
MNYQPPIEWSEGTPPQTHTQPRPAPSFTKPDFPADETGYPLSPKSPHLHPSASLPESKRDKKRREIGDRLTSLNAEFLHSREDNFRSTLQKLQAELTALHDGGNLEFLDQVEILEDARDKELVQIEAGRGYALLRAEREYQDEMQRAEEEYVVSPPLPGSRISFLGHISNLRGEDPETSRKRDIIKRLGKQESTSPLRQRPPRRRRKFPHGSRLDSLRPPLPKLPPPNHRPPKTTNTHLPSPRQRSRHRRLRRHLLQQAAKKGCSFGQRGNRDPPRGLRFRTTDCDRGAGRED